MFPNNYFNKGRFTSCFKELIREEGFTSLWKGFPLHLLGIIIWMSVLPNIVDLISANQN